MQPLWETMVVLKNLKIELPYDPATTPGCISAENESTDFKRSIPVFTCVVTSAASDSLLTLRNVARQATPSMGFSRQESFSGRQGSPPGDLPNTGIKPLSLMSPLWAGGFCTTNATVHSSIIYNSQDMEAM